MRGRHFIVCGFALLALVSVCTPALAAEVATPSWGGIAALATPWIEAAASGVVTALIGWIAVVVQRYLGLRIEASHREALHSAAMTGVRQALNRLQAAANAAPIEGRTAIVASAVGWMQQSVPDAIRYFGLDPRKLETLAASKLTELLPAPTPEARLSVV